MSSEKIKHFSLLIIFLFFVLFLYAMGIIIKEVKRTQIGTNSGIYTSYVSSSHSIKKKALALTQLCNSRYCQIQTLLDFVSNIPYQTETFQKKKPLQTIDENLGDCDDKSNLLISLLHALDIKAYFVLVPKHIFLIVPLEDRRVRFKKGLWIDGKKYYILETTATGSLIGYPLRYRLSDIDAVLEPFSNQKIVIKRLDYGQ